jgi:hypothetical protein
VREFEQGIMVHDRTEYMADGTRWWPSKVIDINVRALGRLADQRRVFRIWKESQKERLRFLPKPIVKVAGGVSRVEMNAKNGALDTPPDTTEALLRKNS